MHPQIVKSLFPPVLWSSCNQAPLAFKAKHPGGSSFRCQTPRLRGLRGFRVGEYTQELGEGTPREEKEAQLLGLNCWTPAAVRELEHWCGRALHVWSVCGKSPRSVGKKLRNYTWRNLSPITCTKRSRSPGSEYGRLASWSPRGDVIQRALHLVVLFQVHKPRLITRKRQTRGRTFHRVAD